MPSVVAQDLSDAKLAVSKVEVAEGASYTVRIINWWGLSALSFKHVKFVSRIHLEDFLDMRKVRETVAAVRTLYVANGYPKASIRLLKMVSQYVQDRLSKNF